MAAGQALPPSGTEVQIDIKQASIAGRGPVQQLADKSGAVLNAQRPSAAERLNQEMEVAHIPDCIRPDALKHAPIRIGGLFDLPILAYEAATGKCKN